jgi:hypothetical protein
MATALRPLQTAIYSKLVGQSSLMAIVSGVWDEVPEPAVFPYVSFGSISEFPDDQHDAQGLNALVTVHIWSKAPGNGEMYDVFAQVDAALDRTQMTVSGFRDVFIKQAQHSVVPDPDPDIRHINVQYRVHMTKE